MRPYVTVCCKLHVGQRIDMTSIPALGLTRVLCFLIVYINTLHAPFYALHSIYAMLISQYK